MVDSAIRISESNSSPDHDAGLTVEHHEHRLLNGGKVAHCRTAATICKLDRLSRRVNEPAMDEIFCPNSRVTGECHRIGVQLRLPSRIAIPCRCTQFDSIDLTTS